MARAVRERGRGRVRSLDGLRGLAALVVLFHHILLASVPRLAAAYATGPLAPRGSLGWLLTFTPLHIVWAGPESVVVFFVLSGFVLALPTARGGARLRIASYYPSRFLRLYLPVWGALAVAAVLHLAISHRAVPGASWWLDAHRQPLEAHAGVRDAALLPGAGDWGFTSVLWSLRWEVLFSLLLPVLLLAPLRARAWNTAGMVLCCVALLGAGGNEYLLELPPFLLGMLLAFRHEQIERLAVALRGRTVRNIAAKVALGVACVCGLTADWWIPGARDAAALVAAGACLALVGALTVGAFRGFLESRPLHWTGRRSYSLYLVHEPIVVALAFLMGGRPSAVPFALLAIPLALAAAAVFFRCVESPSHWLARVWTLRHVTAESHDGVRIAGEVREQRPLTESA